MDQFKSIETTELVKIANAIRSKTGSSEKISLEDIPNKIREIEGGIDTSDATAEQSDIFINKTAYVDGEKITGTFTIDNELTAQDNLISQIQTALQNKVANDSESENLDNELTTQENLISQLSSILDSKASGSGGSVTFETDSFTVTDNGMFEPGMNEYILSSPNLKGLSRSGIMFFNQQGLVGVLLRIDDDWEYHGSGQGYIAYAISYGSCVTNDQVYMYGEIPDRDINDYYFIAF